MRQHNDSRGFICGCGKLKAYSAKRCMSCYRTPWTEAEDAMIRAKYPSMGAKALATYIPNHSYQHIQARAYALGVILTKKARKRLSYDLNAERMRLDNPSRRPGASERIKQTSRSLWNRPEVAAKMMKGSRDNQKGKPTKLELKLFTILDALKVAYESYVIVKSHFIVDVRIGDIIIQADGDWWHGHTRFYPLMARQSKQQLRDAAQDAYLHKCGYTVIRIWESDMSLKTVQSKLAEVGALIQPMLLVSP